MQKRQPYPGERGKLKRHSLAVPVPELLKPTTPGEMVRAMAEAMNKLMRDQVKKDRELLHLNLKVDPEEGIWVLKHLQAKREAEAEREALGGDTS